MRGVVIVGNRGKETPANNLDADLHRWLSVANPNLARKLVFVTGGAFSPYVRENLDTVDNLRFDKPFDPSGIQSLVAGLVSMVKV